MHPTGAFVGSSHGGGARESNKLCHGITNMALFCSHDSTSFTLAREDSLEIHIRPIHSICSLCLAIRHQTKRMKALDSSVTCG